MVGGYFVNQATYSCGCGYFFGNSKPRIGSLCPGCGHPIASIRVQEAQRSEYEPGVGLAIFSVLISFFIPVLPILLSIFIAIKGRQWLARIISIVGVGINLAISAAILYAVLK